MEVQIFQQKDLDTENPDIAVLLKGAERRQELNRELGLKGQQKFMDCVEKARNIPFKLLSPEEREIWEEFLPDGHYSHFFLSSRPGSLDNILTDYDSELIPLNVLELWQHCLQMGFFDAYELRADLRKGDPVLLGRLGPLTFMIARWGEALRPFEEIRSEIEENWKHRRRTGNPFG